MNVEYIPRNADLIAQIDQLIDTASFERLKHDLRENFAGHRAVFFRGSTLEFTPIARRTRGKYMPSLVGHRG